MCTQCLPPLELLTTELDLTALAFYASHDEGASDDLADLTLEFATVDDTLTLQ
jgi:hypothetical protein